MKTTVMAIEDEQDTADLLKSVLEREGFSVVHAQDGRQATLLIETMRPPSLVLLDIVIPYVNGFELLRVIRQHPDWQHIPVIVVSADYYEPDIRRALSEGATAYVVKQPGLQDLVQAITRILRPAAPGLPVVDQAIVKAATKAPHKRRPSGRHGPRSR